MAEVKSPSTNQKLWLWVGAIGLTALVLGYLGNRHMLLVDFHQDPDGNRWDWTQPIYYTLSLFVLNGPPWRSVPWTLDLARFLAPLATGTGVFTAVYSLFNSQLWKLKIWRWKNHVIICGLGYKGFTFVQRLRESGYKVVVIESAADNPAIEDCKVLRVPVIVGDAQHEPILREAGIERAEWLLAVCPDDAVNTEIMLSARNLVGQREGQILRCLAQISDTRLCSVLQAAQEYQGSPGWTASFFNTDDTAAALMLAEYPVVAAKDGEPPHLLVAHLDPLGRQLLVLSAQRWLTERVRSTTPTSPLLVTIVDDDADGRLRGLTRQHPMFGDPNKVKVYKSSLSAESVAELTDRYNAADDPPPGRAFVAAKEDKHNVATALMLRHSLNLPIKVVAALSRAQGTGKLLHSLKDIHVEVFATFEKTCTPELLFKVSVEDLAKEIHAIWVAEQEVSVPKKRAKIEAALERLEPLLDDGGAVTIAGALPETMSDEDVAEPIASIKASIGRLADESEESGQTPMTVTVADVVAELRKTLAEITDPPAWEDEAAAPLRPSSMAQAHDIPVKLRSIDCSIKSLPEGQESEFTFTDEEVERLAVQEHDRWNSERFNAGWTLAKKKDLKKKTSPYLVPFGDLPDDIAEYDRIFVKRIPMILKKARLQAVRNPKDTDEAEDTGSPAEG